MSNQIYPHGAEKIISGEINFLSDNLACALMPTAGFSAANAVLAQLAAPVASKPMTNVSVVDGVVDADDVNFGAVDAGKTIASIVIYKDTGDAATSPLLFYYDNIQGFPMVTTGTPVLIPWSNGDNKIGRIAGQFFPKGASEVLKGAVNFLTDDIKVGLLPSSYQFNEAHATLADVGGSANLAGTPQLFQNKSVTSGVFNANPMDFGLVASGKSVGSAVIYKDGGSDANSPVLVHVTGLYGVPFDTNGAQVTLQWATDSAKIFSLKVY